MPKKTATPAPGAGKSPISAPPGKKALPNLAPYWAPHWAAKAGKGMAPAPKPLRLPGKGRGG